MTLAVTWVSKAERAVLSVAMVRLVYTVQFLVVTQVRPCTHAIVACILNTYLGTELSYAMSEFYEATNKNPQSCSFSGNAVVNPSASASASAVASSCFANAAAVFTPSAPATGVSSPTSTSKSHSGSVRLVGNPDAIVGMSVMAIVAVMSAIWTLV